MINEACDWCRIVQIEGVSVLFYQDFNHDDDTYQINTLVKTDGALMNIKVVKAEPFSQEQFNGYVGEDVARAAIKQACDLGFEPVISIQSKAGVSGC